MHFFLDQIGATGYASAPIFW